MAKTERISKGRYRDIFRKLMAVRKFEEKVDELFKAGEIYGSVHTSVGQEAVAVGASGSGGAAPSGMGEAAAASRGEKKRPVVRDMPKVGRNDPCPCGSGKKYKKCHGAGA